MDCRWSSWGIWSSCSSSCGNGVQSRIRTIARTAKYGGEKCSGRKRGQRSCNQRKCPGMISKIYAQPECKEMFIYFFQNIASGLLGADGQNVLSLVEEDRKKDKGL